MIVVSDTSPLNYLILIEATHVLPAIFGRVYAPSAVVRELSHPRSPESVKMWASQPPGWLTIQDPTQIDGSLKLGDGETAAINLAVELQADLILIDERKGYRAAVQRGLKVSSTLGLLEEASYRRMLHFEAAIERLVNETSFYVAEDVLAEYRRRAAERRAAAGANHAPSNGTAPEPDGKPSQDRPQ